MIASPIVEVSARHRAVVVPFSADLAGLTSLMSGDMKRLTYKGQDSIVLPHNADTVRFLRNARIHVPAPIITHYDWAGNKPFEAQRQTAALLTIYDRAYVLNGMGTGKTRSALFAFDFLRREGLARKMLVCAPLSTLNRTWAHEIFGCFPHLKFAILYGDKNRRLQRLAEDVDVYIVNHDGVGVIFNELLARTDIDVLCLDELAIYRNPTAVRTKTMRKLASTKRRVWGLTGSPTPNGPTDAYGQLSIITPHAVPMSFRLFREQVMIRVAEYKWIPKPDAMDRVQKLFQPSVRFTLDDVVELPELVMREVQVDMGPKQRALYEQLRKHLHAMVSQKEITVANAGVLTNKLLQCALGWVYTTERGTVALDNDARLEALNDAIESTDRKVIVFVPFIHALEGIAEYLRKHGHEVATVSGETPPGKRTDIFTAFQTLTNPRVIVAHPQCMAHGLTLTAADTIVWFGPFPSLEVFDQANARITRVGQKHRQQVLMFSGTPVESKLYKRLREKQDVQGALLEMLADQDSHI
jgi:SNF2 family DNA or RNA helicase